MLAMAAYQSKVFIAKSNNQTLPTRFSGCPSEVRSLAFDRRCKKQRLGFAARLNFRRTASTIRKRALFYACVMAVVRGIPSGMPGA